MSAGSSAELDIVSACFTLAYLTGGAATVNGAHAARGDALFLSGANSMTVRATAPIDLFVVSVPVHPMAAKGTRWARVQDRGKGRNGAEITVLSGLSNISALCKAPMPTARRCRCAPG